MYNMGRLEEDKKREGGCYIDSSFISMKDFKRLSLLLEQIRGTTDGIVIEGLELLNREAEEDTLSLDTDSSGSFANNSLVLNAKRLPRRTAPVRRRPKPDEAMRRASTGSNIADLLKTVELEHVAKFKKIDGALSSASRRRFSNCAA
jgi:hypothetical protein